MHGRSTLHLVGPLLRETPGRSDLQVDTESETPCLKALLRYCTTSRVDSLHCGMSRRGSGWGRISSSNASDMARLGNPGRVLFYLIEVLTDGHRVIRCLNEATPWTLGTPGMPERKASVLRGVVRYAWH